MAGSFHYLKKRGHTWYFQRAVPKDLRTKLGKEQIVETLGTRDVSVAMSRRTERAAHWEAVFARLRGTLRPSEEVTPRTAYNETVEYFRQSSGVEAALANSNCAPGDEPITEMDVLQDRLLEEAGEEFGRDDGGRPLAMSPVQEAMWDAIQDHQRDLKGKQAKAASRYGLKISEARDRYLSRLEQGGDRQTIRQHGTTLTRFAEFLSDKSLQSVTKADVGRFMGVLETLNPNWGKSPKDKVRSFEEIRRRYGGTRRQLSDNTLNRHLGAIRALWRWATAAGEVEGECPATGLERRVSKKSAKDRTYATFEISEIHGLFTGRLPKNHDVVEVCMVGLYSGMRLGEICVLDWEDVRTDQDVTYFDIGKAKSVAGVRRVPIHAELHWLLERRQSRGPIWPALKRRGQGAASQRVTKAFSHFKKSKGFDERKKVFHSFRKTFVSVLARKGAQEAHIAQIVGHEHNQITFSVYNPDGFPLAQCKSIVDTFSVPDFDPCDVVARSLVARERQVPIDPNLHLS